MGAALAACAAFALPVAAQAPVGSGSPQTPAPAAAPKNDYADAANWLCRPGREDACAVDLTTTVVAADGKLSVEKFVRNADAPIDCFYVYPTVSADATPNSDMKAGPEEQNVIRGQFARFGSQCRTYAPLYRQVTLTALRAATAGQPLQPDRALAYSDVLAAWKHYLESDNQGRGVVLIGHSQGAGVLTQLIREEIDGKPVQPRVISALLLGTNLAVPKGKDVGGAFQNIPLCKTASQIGCAISYVSFRASAPPPENSRFGKVQGEGQQAACVNPAALGGGSGQLKAHLASGPRAGESAITWAKGASVQTPFVSVPGLLSSECVSNAQGFSYLAVKVNADPADPRVDDIAGDVVTGGEVRKEWGLHIVDMAVAMGNLVDIVGQQSKAYLASKK